MMECPSVICHRTGICSDNAVRNRNTKTMKCGALLCPSGHRLSKFSKNILLQAIHIPYGPRLQVMCNFRKGNNVQNGNESVLY
ncbi:hypothetical protein DICVIV_06107 [Dictyocaulus viviparus]|uniref:Uncharacterized protein n=1 Tax=Dictyocaulus viviparus TaxID=29172 RepID=A0A0D8XTI2_DICVI|nr:hypothetical protein DICVIV_06107 [Dictyocaulus viviparus]